MPTVSFTSALRRFLDAQGFLEMEGIDYNILKDLKRIRV